MYLLFFDMHSNIDYFHLLSLIVVSIVTRGSIITKNVYQFVPQVKREKLTQIKSSVANPFAVIS